MGPTGQLERGRMEVGVGREGQVVVETSLSQALISSQTVRGKNPQSSEDFTQRNKLQKKQEENHAWCDHIRTPPPPACNYHWIVMNLSCINAQVV